MTMRRRMNELLQAARSNDEIFAKTRSLNLALLEVNNWPELNEVLATHVLVDFEADFVCAHLVKHIWPWPLTIFNTTMNECRCNTFTTAPVRYVQRLDAKS